MRISRTNLITKTQTALKKQHSTLNFKDSPEKFQ